MLTEKQCKSAKHPSKPSKLYDSNGLYLHVQKSGKYWRYDYAYDGKRKTLALGVYPKVSLKDARAGHRQARDWLSDGLNPATQQKRTKATGTETSFKAMTERWLAQHDVSDSSKSIIRRRFNLYVYPLIGAMDVSVIRKRHIMMIIEDINSQGIPNTAARVRRMISQVFQYCSMHELVESDPASALKQAIKRSESKNLPAITDPEEFGQLLRDIDNHDGNYMAGFILKLAPYVALRHAELRQGRWSEIDFKNALWTVPAARMKRRKEHLVPLSTQALEILKELYKVTGKGDVMFPSPTLPRQPVSHTRVNEALNNLGYQNKHVVHGFRSTFSTICNRAGKDSELIEAQLAHMDKDRIRAAYMRTDWMDERRELLNWWGDEVDKLRSA